MVLKEKLQESTLVIISGLLNQIKDLSKLEMNTIETFPQNWHNNIGYVHKICLIDDNFVRNIVLAIDDKEINARSIR